MTTDPLASFHAWLLDANKRFGSVTVVQLMEEIGRLREAAGLAPYASLPQDGITCQQWLERLAAQGRAKRLNASGQADAKGSFWRWADGHPQVKVEQTRLF